MTTLTQSFSDLPYNTTIIKTFDLSGYNVKAVVGGIKQCSSQLSSTGGSVTLRFDSCTYDKTTKKATVNMWSGSSAVRNVSCSCFVTVIE